MILVDGEKYSCIQCIRGHRSSSCAHTTRPLLEVRQRGRPNSECNYRVVALADLDPKNVSIINESKKSRAKSVVNDEEKPSTKSNCGCGKSRSISKPQNKKNCCSSSAPIKAYQHPIINLTASKKQLANTNGGKLTVICPNHDINKSPDNTISSNINLSNKSSSCGSEKCQCGFTRSSDHKHLLSSIKSLGEKSTGKVTTQRVKLQRPKSKTNDLIFLSFDPKQNTSVRLPDTPQESRKNSIITQRQRQSSIVNFNNNSNNSCCCGPSSSNNIKNDELYEDGYNATAQKMLYSTHGNSSYSSIISNNSLSMGTSMSSLTSMTDSRMLDYNNDNQSQGQSQLPSQSQEKDLSTSLYSLSSNNQNIIQNINNQEQNYIQQMPDTSIYNMNLDKQIKDELCDFDMLLNLGIDPQFAFPNILSEPALSPTTTVNIMTSQTQTQFQLQDQRTPPSDNNASTPGISPKLFEILSAPIEDINNCCCGDDCNCEGCLVHGNIQQLLNNCYDNDNNNNSNNSSSINNTPRSSINNQYFNNNNQMELYENINNDDIEGIIDLKSPRSHNSMSTIKQMIKDINGNNNDNDNNHNNSNNHNGLFELLDDCNCGDNCTCDNCIIHNEIPNS